MSNAATERGLLVKLDEGFFARLDHETAIRRAASRPPWAAARIRLHRTDVVRSLLREALDARALARGEVVPESVEADVTKSDRGATPSVGGAEPGSVPVKEADTEAVTAPIPVEAYAAVTNMRPEEGAFDLSSVAAETPGENPDLPSSEAPFYMDPGAPVKNVGPHIVRGGGGAEKGIRGGVGRLDGGDPAAATPEPEPEPVEVGHVGGEGALGPNVRMVGVRRT